MYNKILIEDIKEKLFQMKKEAGLLLLEIRLRNGLTQQFVAESINMSYRSLYSIEKRYGTSLDEILKLYTFYYSKNYGTEEDEEKFRRIVSGK